MTKKINGPTILTILRILLAILFFIFILLPYQWSKITALSLFIVAAITDYIDGRWARKDKLVTDLGAFLDPLADKTLVSLALLALINLQVIPVWVFAIILVRDLAIDGIRMSSAKKNITISASKLGKVKTAVQMVSLVFLQIYLFTDNQIIYIIGTTILYLALLFTIVSGVEYITKGWKRLAK